MSRTVTILISLLLRTARAVFYAKLCYFFTHTTQHRQILLIGSRPSLHGVYSLCQVPIHYAEAFVTQQTKGVCVHTTYERLLNQCFSTAVPRPGTGPWHQLYRAARGLRKLQYATRFH